MKHWYVAHSNPQAEDKAVHNLTAQGFEVFLPRYHKVRRHARKTDVVIAPLFPRYLFVAFDVEVDRWLCINSTKGISYLLRQNGCPMKVPDGIVEALQETASPEKIVPLSTLVLFKQGDRLEVQEGAFSGHVGIFEKMTDGERVQLLLNLLGREVRMALPIQAVQAV